jgi:SEC-C motif-containing protein
MKTKKTARSRVCPCHSSLPYASCCAPFISGERAAPTPEALMRSRYAAFALGAGRYLVETLSDDHPDRSLDEDELVRALSRAKDTQRFLGLTILSTTGDANSPVGAKGSVHFAARIFERGEDRSFEERSTFIRTLRGWRYQAGEIVPAESHR